MKKVISLLAAFVCSLCLAIGLNFLPTTKLAANSESSLYFPSQILSYVRIADGGRALTQADFEPGKTSLNDGVFLRYSTNDLVISKIDNSNPDVGLDVSVNGQPIELQHTSDPLTGDFYYYLVNNQGNQSYIRVDILATYNGAQNSLCFYLIATARPADVLEYVNITQEDYTFAGSDFVIGEVEGINQITLYTNKTITISKKDLVQPEVEEGQPVEPLPTVDLQVNFNSTDINSGNSHYREVDGKPCYFVNLDEINEAKPYTRIYLRVTVNSVQQELVFYLVQTKLKLASGLISWAENNNPNDPISAPNASGVYSPLNITVPSGTPSNPIFIKFTHWGETFIIFNIGNGKYYNASDFTSPQQIRAINDQTKSLDFTQMVFYISGVYEVEVYDYTINSNYESNNHQTYNFTVLDTTNADTMIYIDAFLESTGETVMNYQYVNENTVVAFRNVADFREQIRNIQITRIYRTSMSDNREETRVIGGNDLANTNDQLLFTDYGTYIISMDIYNVNEVVHKEFTFDLINDIKMNFTFAGTYYSVGDDEEANVTKTIELQNVVETTYGEPDDRYNISISSITKFDFHILLARSAASIDGIGNRARTSGNVNLSVHGVGNLSVSISQDGKSYSRTYSNGENLPTFSDPGKYYIKLTDEMGNTVTKSFTITIKMNTAAIILIVLGVVMVAFTIVFIIISRTRVKVR